jgi:TusA-related sulfurtransferase
MIEAHTTCETGSLSLTDGLAVLLHRRLDALEPGQTLEVRSADPNLHHDVRAWARLSGHRLIHSAIDDTGTIFWVQRGTVLRVISAEAADWNNHAAIEDGHLSTRAMLIGAAARIPSHAHPDTGFSPRGAVVENGSPEYPFDVLDAAAGWSPESSDFYDQAGAGQWNASTDIPWAELHELEPDLERAVCQMMTFLAENEFAALYVPAKWIPRIHPHFLETVLFLSTQVRDEARHIEVFTKRALANGGGLQFSSSSTQQSLKSLLDREDFLQATFLLGVLGEGTFLDLLRFAETFAPDPATREIARRTRIDEARHVHFALSHIEHAIASDSQVKRRLSAAILDRAAELSDIKILNPLVEESLVILAAGGLQPARLPFGVGAVRELHATMHENRVKRLQSIGFSDSESEELSRIHTPNFM